MGFKVELFDEAFQLKIWHSVRSKSQSYYLYDIYSETNTALKIIGSYFQRKTPSVNYEWELWLLLHTEDPLEKLLENTEFNRSVWQKEHSFPIYFESKMITIDISGYENTEWKIKEFRGPLKTWNSTSRSTILKVTNIWTIQPKEISFMLDVKPDVPSQRSDVSTNQGNDGGFIPDDLSQLLLHLHSISEFILFCEHLGLGSNECHKIEKERSGDLGTQKSDMLWKWHTWRDFIKPFALLDKCSKANELAKKYHVTFDSNGEVIKMCPKINDG